MRPRLFDRRRWRAVWMAIRCDTLLTFGFWERDGQPVHQAVAGIVDDAEGRSKMIEFAEDDLGQALREGLFDRLPDWVAGKIEPQPQPELDAQGRLDPRRFAAMRDVATGQGFLSIAVWNDGAHTATALMPIDEHRADALEACELLADALRNGKLDATGGRFEWHPQDRMGGGDFQ
jgi:hypothetical protein